MTLALSQPAQLHSPSEQQNERDAHYERLFWLATMADGDATVLAKHVLDRLQLETLPDENDTFLLDMETGDRRRVEIYLSTLASRRLIKRSLDQRRYARTIGHPIDAPQEAFEAGGEPEIAAAYCALMHDKLTDTPRSDTLRQQDASLRFSVARLLALVRPESTPACRTLATKALDRLSAFDRDGALGDAMRAWLGTTLRPVVLETPPHEPAASTGLVDKAVDPVLRVQPLVEESRFEDARLEDARFGALPSAAQSFL